MILLIIIVILVIIFTSSLTIFLYDKKTEFTEYTPNDFGKIAILTVEDRDEGYIKDHDKNVTEYCEKYNYDYIRLNNCEVGINTYWCKIYLVLQTLLTNKYSYVMWLDSDTVLPNKSIRIEHIITEINKSIIIGIDCVKFCAQFHIINSGVFIIKNDTIGTSFLKECIDLFEFRKNECVNSDNSLKGIWADRCYEQGIMNEILLKKDNNKYTNDVFIDYKSKYIYNYNGLYYLFFKLNTMFDKYKKYFVIHLSSMNNYNRANYINKWG